METVCNSFFERREGSGTAVNGSLLLRAVSSFNCKKFTCSCNCKKMFLIKIQNIMKTYSRAQRELRD